MEQKDKSTKKKILFISTKSVWGGAQRYIADLIDYLPRDCFEIVVAAGGKGPFYAKVIERGIAYHEIAGLERNINPFKEIIAFFRILSIIRKIKPDILHLNSSKAAFLGAYAGWLARVPKIISSTHGWPFLEERPKIERIALKLLTKIGIWPQDAVICVSQFDYSIGVHEHIASQRKLISIQNGIDPKKHVFLERHQARGKLYEKIHLAPNNYFIVGTIAEYTKNKGLSYLIEAAAHVVKIEPHTIFLLMGWGEEKYFLERKIESHGLQKNVFLIEFLPEAFSYLKALDIFILPSLKEGFAYSLLEASLAELPIITTSVGGNPEIVENLKNGLLVDPRSPHDIINAISYLMRNPVDRAALGGAARRKVASEFSIETMVKKTIAVYEYGVRAP